MSGNNYDLEAEAYMRAASAGQEELMAYINTKINDPQFAWPALHLSLVDLEKSMTKQNMAQIHILVEAVRFARAIEPYIRESGYGNQ